MKKQAHKAVAKSKGRSVYYLTEDEAQAIERMRFDAQEAKRPLVPKCLYLQCRAKSKRDGYCLSHWNMLERQKAHETTD